MRDRTRHHQRIRLETSPSSMNAITRMRPPQLVQAQHVELEHAAQHRRPIGPPPAREQLKSEHRSGPAVALLDFGCGPGRDLAYFRSLGHEVTGLDGCAAFVEAARARTGCEVWQQDFLRLALPSERFDGVFANASLFHVPTQELPRVLGELRAGLKPRGVLFSSNPRGEGE